MEQDSHGSSSHFCFGRDEIGHLTRECIVDRVTTMTRTEKVYAYHRFFPGGHNRYQTSVERNMVSINHKWRASLCKWSYNVTDYFDMSRDVVAISMKLFDNYFATRRCVCDKGLILLASIATLHIAIKVRESVVIRLETLCEWCRFFEDGKLFV